MNRLKNRFEALRDKGEMGIIPYLTVGFPSVEDTLNLIPALAAGGADVIELGVPFSDPLADGPTIQRSSFHALSQGVNLAVCMDVCKELRQRGLETPIVLMGYYNPIFNYGLRDFAERCKDSGVDGLIVPDLPYEESSPLKQECQSYGINVIPLLAPTSTDSRIQQTCEGAEGFVYCVSLTGVTGAREEIPDSVPDFIRRVKKYVNIPIAVGFGISKRSHVESLTQIADAAVVGSALIEMLENTQSDQREEVVKQFVSQLKGNYDAQGGQ